MPAASGAVPRDKRRQSSQKRPPNITGAVKAACTIGQVLFTDFEPVSGTPAAEINVLPTSGEPGVVELIFTSPLWNVQGLERITHNIQYVVQLLSTPPGDLIRILAVSMNGSTNGTNGASVLEYGCLTSFAPCGPPGTDVPSAPGFPTLASGPTAEGLQFSQQVTTIYAIAVTKLPCTPNSGAGSAQVFDKIVLQAGVAPISAPVKIDQVINEFSISSCAPAPAAAIR